jgi:trans-2,3-dihydro-3-hydroxyanthranilate isomerase
MQYIIADVFTDLAFGGNQLAVFHDADGLDARQMQAMAREMNFAESTFVTAGSAPGRLRVRIFTPMAEMVFAGHPTIGTAVVLAHLGRTEGFSEIVLEENIGPVRVALHEGGATLFMDGPAETRPHSVVPVALADALGLKRAQLAGDPWQAGYGTPFMIVPVRDKAAVAESTLHADRWHALTQGLWGGRAVYIYAAISHDGPSTHIHARMFAPKLGVTEDPATGSAAAALAGSIDTDATHLVIDQGVEMGRPSRLEARITRAEDGAVTGVAIGGSAVVVAEGRFLRLP